jgi:hypothetical protein
LGLVGSSEVNQTYAEVRQKKIAPRPRSSHTHTHKCTAQPARRRVPLNPQTPAKPEAQSPEAGSSVLSSELCASNPPEQPNSQQEPSLPQKRAVS